MYRDWRKDAIDAIDFIERHGTEEQEEQMIKIRSDLIDYDNEENLFESLILEGVYDGFAEHDLDYWRIKAVEKLDAIVEEIELRSGIAYYVEDEDDDGYDYF